MQLDAECKCLTCVSRQDIRKALSSFLCVMIRSQERQKPYLIPYTLYLLRRVLGLKDTQSDKSWT